MIVLEDGKYKKVNSRTGAVIEEQEMKPEPLRAAGLSMLVGRIAAGNRSRPS
jgi:hypothetical protein